MSFQCLQTLTVYHLTLLHLLVVCEVSSPQALHPIIQYFQKSFFYFTQVEEAKCYCLNITGQCLKTGDKYLGRGSRQAVVLTSFNEGEGANVVAYKDINNDEADLFIEQLGASGKLR